MLKVEKLNEKLLEDVAGGTPSTETGRKALQSIKYINGLRLVPAIAGVGYCIASCVDFYKANKAKNSGNISDYNKYIKKAQNCTIATASLMGVGVLGGVASFATSCVFGDDINAYQAEQPSELTPQIPR